MKSKREHWDGNNRRSYFQSLIDLFFLVDCVGKEFLDNCIKPINYYLKDVSVDTKRTNSFLPSMINKISG